MLISHRQQHHHHLGMNESITIVCGAEWKIAQYIDGSGKHAADPLLFSRLIVASYYVMYKLLSSCVRMLRLSALWRPRRFILRFKIHRSIHHNALIDYIVRIFKCYAY